MRTFRSPLGRFVIGSVNDNAADKSSHIINRRYDPNIVIPYSVNPNDIVTCLSYQELSDKLSVKYNLISFINNNGEIEFRRSAVSEMEAGV